MTFRLVKAAKFNAYWYNAVQLDLKQIREFPTSIKTILRVLQGAISPCYTQQPLAVQLTHKNTYTFAHFSSLISHTIKT